jgi:hypothetical protein
MHQPIQWHEWGEQAFAEAQRADKPVLLDIGAVWCHWCHVMDRESYDDPQIAEIVNQHFLAIKVDRDERPDIDSRYQIAVSSISGQGGWPLTAFLTPDGKPFFGGTYFPPQDYHGRPSFRRVLLSISEAYRQKNSDVLDQAKLVEAAISQAESFAGAGGSLSWSVVDAIVKAGLGMFDERNGGFGSSPKFPHPAALNLVIDQFLHTRDEPLRQLFVTTLEKMARGGVYDQLAGGFHRYSVDERWGVPHFEKMCYDNSELLMSYVHAYQATGSQFFADVARDIIRWMEEWLSDRREGGFYASQDADYSMDDDGDYFTWTLAETREVLSETEAAVATLHYGIQEVGEMHHNPAKNVLSLRVPIPELASRLHLDPQQVAASLKSAKEKMYAARLKRPTPYVDKTVYVGWNALCISAYLEAARVLEIDSARAFALRSLDRILDAGWSERGWLHVVAYSEADAPRRDTAGGLDDYAFTTIACLDAYQATAKLAYFERARQIADAMIEGFYDETGGGFFDTPKASEAETRLGVLNTRRKPFQDSPTPAGNSIAAIALMRLYLYTHHQPYREKAEQTLEVIAAAAGQFGIFAATYGMAAVHLLRPHAQAVIVGNGAEAGRLEQAALRGFALGKSVIRLEFDEAVAPNLPPALAETIPQLPTVQSRQTAAVVCSDFTCQAATTDPHLLATELAPKAHANH